MAELGGSGVDEMAAGAARDRRPGPARAHRSGRDKGSLPAVTGRRPGNTSLVSETELGRPRPYPRCFRGGAGAAAAAAAAAAAEAAAKPASGSSVLRE